MRKFMLIPVVLLAAVATFAYAQQGHDRHHRPGAPFMHELHELSLTDSQKADIKQLVKSSFEQMKPRMQAARKQRIAFEALAPDATDYDSAAQALAQTEASNASARVLQLTSLKQQIYQRLTPDQKQQLAALEAKRQAHIAKWRAQHPPHGDRDGDD
ncbi:MAG: Spy/CpxP family protein refolding chaperone [Stenotrophobium sp.]